MKTDKDLITDVIFEDDKLKEYYYKYEGSYAEVSQATRFHERTDLSTTYLGKIDMTRDMIIKAEEKFPISGQGYTNGKLLENTEWSILIYTGAVSPVCQIPIICNVNHFMHYQKSASSMWQVQVGNGQCVAVLFVIPVIKDVYGHRFGVFTFTWEIHGNVDLVLGMKNMFELEGVIDMWASSFKFLNRMIPFSQWNR